MYNNKYIINKISLNYKTISIYTSCFFCLFVCQYEFYQKFSINLNQLVYLCRSVNVILPTMLFLLREAGHLLITLDVKGHGDTVFRAVLAILGQRS